MLFGDFGKGWFWTARAEKRTSCCMNTFFIVKSVLEKGGGGENILTLVCNFEKSGFGQRAGRTHP
jgi:hypothetical protein